MPRGQFLNFATIRGILYRQRWLMVTIIFLALIGGLVTTLLSTPMYEANAKVAVKPFGQSVIEGRDLTQGFSPNQIFDYLGTQVEVIKSRNLAEVVAADLDLASRDDFLGKNVDEGRSPGMSDEQWHKQKEQIAASILVGGVVAEVPTNNWVIEIGYRSPIPALSAEIANAYAEAFVSTGSRESIENNEYALEYLKQQIDETRERLGEAERVTNAYARNSGIIVQTPAPEEYGGNQTLTGANLASINARVASARAARIEAEQRWRAIQNLPAAELPEVQSNPVLQGLVSERTGKLTQLADLRQRYNDDFPQIQNLLAQVKVLDAQIERSSKDIKASARSQFLVAQSQQNALEAELASLTGNRLVEQDQQVELSVLEREAQALRDQLRILLDRYNTVNSAANVDPGTVSLIDSAIVPGSPYAPNIPRTMGLALVLGIALAAGLAVLRETLDDRLRSLDEVEEKVGLALLGHTPHVEDRDLQSLSTDPLRRFDGGLFLNPGGHRLHPSTQSQRHPIDQQPGRRRQEHDSGDRGRTLCEPWPQNTADRCRSAASVSGSPARHRASQGRSGRSATRARGTRIRSSEGLAREPRNPAGWRNSTQPYGNSRLAGDA
jgi:Uncharacterized protein involved in exopolysaccharide biosynthesis